MKDKVWGGNRMAVYYLPRIGKTFGSLDPRHIVTVTLWSYGPGTSPGYRKKYLPPPNTQV